MDENGYVRRNGSNQIRFKWVKRNSNLWIKIPFNLTNELTKLTERDILTSFERLGLKDKLKSSRRQSGRSSIFQFLFLFFQKTPKKKKKKKRKGNARNRHFYVMQLLQSTCHSTPRASCHSSEEFRFLSLRLCFLGHDFPTFLLSNSRKHWGFAFNFLALSFQSRFPEILKFPIPLQNSASILPSLISSIAPG